VETFTRGASQADDLTLLIVRYRASATNGGNGQDTDTNLPATDEASLSA